MNRSLIIVLFVVAISLAACNKNEVVTIHLAGDSTVADKPYRHGNPEKGWGQVFPLYFEPGVFVQNHGVNGRSTKSFIDEGRWSTLLESLKPGDYVFIQFGHNDSKEDDSTRYAAPFSDYRNNLIKMVDDVVEKGGTPVLLTSIVRRRFNDDGVFYDTHGDYPAVVRSVAQEKEVLLFDLHKLSKRYIKTLGSELSKKIFLHINKIEYPDLTDHILDDTHLSAIGAFRISDMVVAEIRSQIPELANKIKN
ncbi:rhamnogalacturonan acetylesterase [Natronoflexus pectinivorans]|uniref:Lysophospholipase L1-like esterase n=1 Tax=Natronoflexus pectinivorans TaxID=682526 RepID=A0A4R2GKM4_9BACT|nr:rhamnogalacturonan acetylesterase [Natronoflexus pectinivorans]TCO08776.1 lysophospholipase L1-like esterase [Natronoflexus pectinivorans]